MEKSLAQVQEKIRDTALKCGRDPAEIGAQPAAQDLPPAAIPEAIARDQHTIVHGGRPQPVHSITQGLPALSIPGGNAGQRLFPGGTEVAHAPCCDLRTTRPRMAG